MIAIITGLLIGMLAGITPGLHPNTLMPLTIILFAWLEPTQFAILLVVLIITANYFEFIKTTYLSSPDEGSSLSLRYTQQLLMDGRGAEAIKLLSIGALGATLITAMITPLIISLVPAVYALISDYVALALILLSLHLILKEGEQIGKATIIFTLSGILGILVLRTQIINQPLLPLLAGLYSTSNIINNIKKQNNVPTQMSRVVTDVDRKIAIKGIMKAVMSSSIITFLPAIGPSQASIISHELVRTNDEKEKLITLGGVNTGDVLFSITALFAINKSRSGVIQQINKSVLNYNNYLLLIITAAITAIICYIIINKMAYGISKQISKINYTKLNKVLLIFVIGLVLLINGWIGILVLLTATLIGMKSNDYDINQNHLMAAIILPTIIYYL
ncbi:MAG: tripartite tricarboxylate transporter permease [Candidatus Nanoarchaeia archaeon]